MPDEQTPVPSPGAELIVEEAMQEDADPLYVALLRPADRHGVSACCWSRA